MNQSVPSLRRLSVALVALLAVVAAGFYSTSAYFSDTATGNYTLATGDANLVWNHGNGNQDTISITAGPFYPGSEETVSNLRLCNIGNVPLDIYYSLTSSDHAFDDQFRVAIGSFETNLGAAVDAGTVPHPDAVQLAANTCGEYFDITIAMEPGSGPQDTFENQTLSGALTVEGRTPAAS